MDRKIGLVSLGITIIVLAIGWYFTSYRIGQLNNENLVQEEERLKSEGISANVKLSTEKEGSKIDINKLANGCFIGKDCIRSIDDPKFEKTDFFETDSFLKDDDIVFGINFKDTSKAYPQKILNWHEVVNDYVGDDPIVVTFSPLSGISATYFRRVNGQTTQFGVSGKLYNSDLIMYDRLEGSLWLQATGESIVGESAKRNEVLQRITMVATTWKKWKDQYPNTLVLVSPQNNGIDYEIYPYDTYEQDGSIYFDVDHIDERLHPKEVIYGVIIDGKAKAYRESRLKSEKRFVDEFNGQKIAVEYSKWGELAFMNFDSRERFSYLRSFWFAWVAFYPESEIY